MGSTPSDVTRLLQLWTDGDRQSGNESDRRDGPTSRWADPVRGDARFERIMGELRFP
jgi:hypothetical protein